MRNVLIAEKPQEGMVDTISRQLKHLKEMTSESLLSTTNVPRVGGKQPISMATSPALGSPTSSRKEAGFFFWFGWKDMTRSLLTKAGIRQKLPNA